MSGNPADRYRIVGRIAAGGMAEIYLARTATNTGAEREVVLKRLLPELQSDHEFVQMFHDEARIACQLNHPNIVQIYELGELDGSLFIAMELLRGVNLRDILARLHTTHQQLPIPLAVRICCEALEGLQYAHSFADQRGRRLNVVHRDVSPQNMIVTYEGTVKMVDFGVAKAEGKLHQTRAGLVKGKFAYMSPEQITGGQVDGRSDIFAIAEVFYELLVRRHPFYAATDMDVLRAILDQEPPHPSQLDAKFPVALGDIFMKAMRKKPQDRYPDCAAMHDALENFLRDQRTPATSIALGRFLRETFSDRMEMEQKARERGDDDLLIEAMTAGRAEYIKSMGKGAIPRVQTGDVPDLRPSSLVGSDANEPTRALNGRGPRDRVIEVSGNHSDDPAERGDDRGYLATDTTGGRLRAEVRNLFDTPEGEPLDPVAQPLRRSPTNEEDATEMPTMLGQFNARDLAEVRSAAAIAASKRAAEIQRGAELAAQKQRTTADPADAARDPGPSREIPPNPQLNGPQARVATTVVVAEESTTSARSDRLGIVFFIAGLGALIGAIVYAALLLSQPKSPTLALVIESTPTHAAVFIDGSDIGARTPVRIPEIGADQAHTIEVKLDGHAPCTKTIDPMPDAVVAELKVQCTLVPTTPPAGSAAPSPSGAAPAKP